MEEQLYKPELSRHQDFAEDIKSVLSDEWKSTPDVITELCGQSEEDGWRDWSREHTKNVLRSMSDIELIKNHLEWLKSKEEPDAGGKKYYWRLNE